MFCSLPAKARAWAVVMPPPNMLELTSVVGFIIYRGGFLLPRTLLLCTYKLAINVNNTTSR